MFAALQYIKYSCHLAATVRLILFFGALDFENFSGKIFRQIVSAYRKKN